MSEKWQQSEICIVIYAKSQRSVAKHLSWDGKVTDKMIDRVISLSPYTFVPKDVQDVLGQAMCHFAKRCRTRQISKMTSVLRTETLINCCCVNLRLLSTNIKLL